MNITVSFAELSEYIENCYKKTLNFSKVSEKEVCVSYSQHILFKTLQIPVNISIDEVKPESLLMTYNGGLGIDMVITGALSFLKTKFPELGDVLVSKGGHQLSIELTQLRQTKGLVESVLLKDIKLHDDSFEIAVALK